jgi:hypothetical protein
MRRSACIKRINSSRLSTPCRELVSPQNRHACVTSVTRSALATPFSKEICPTRTRQGATTPYRDHQENQRGFEQCDPDRRLTVAFVTCCYPRTAGSSDPP